MKSLTKEYIQENFDAVLDSIEQENEPVIIVESAKVLGVMISFEMTKDFERLQEFYLFVQKYAEERKKIWDEFYDDAVKSHQHYVETGLHVTMEEMKAWAEALKTDRNTPLPKSHT